MVCGVKLRKLSSKLMNSERISLVLTALPQFRGHGLVPTERVSAVQSLLRRIRKTVAGKLLVRAGRNWQRRATPPAGGQNSDEHWSKPFASHQNSGRRPSGPH